ncbi:MAG: DUF2341 domain-containing protein [Theionarchaea archaeon]|nr:DUF2341 domain-containing protein [Theionarchaea archaeon]
MKKAYRGLIAAILFMGLFSHAGNVVGRVTLSSDDLMSDLSFDVLRHFVLRDAEPVVEEPSGYTETPVHQPLQIHASEDPQFEYMAVSPYYKVYFKGTSFTMRMRNAWVAFELKEQNLGEKRDAISLVNQNSLSLSNVFESVDLSYELDTSLVKETLTLRESKQASTVIQKISWGGVTPQYAEDGSILFIDGNEEKIVKILPPFMRDARGSICTDIHYELIQTETGHELHKVIHKEGLEWLEKAVYPVVIDPSMETFEDAWQSSGLTPYGQYFRNLKEYVNPATGYLTVTQTDLAVPGRGLDLVISRVYETPAVFYGSDPYDYEAPPVDLGKGWQLNFPYVGSKYLHLWGGTVYKIQWNNNTFENHKGSHFTLVKNGDNTYTLTTASSIVYEFNTSGELTEIKDLDQNTITFNYSEGSLVSITDTIGRSVSLTYSNNRLSKITYNSAEIEFSYDANGCLQWMEDFLNRRTSYTYDSEYNYWLLSEIEYPTSGYTEYTYGRFEDSDYYKYYVDGQTVYETDKVCYYDFSYTGSFSAITSSTTTVENESSVTKGFYDFTVSNGLITQKVVKNASETAIRKYTYTYDSSNAITQEGVYSDGSTLSYTNYYSYDNWGNIIYTKNGESHEKFFSYANTDTSGFFVDKDGNIIKIFTNAFSNSTVPSSVHTALIGSAEKQDSTYVNELYITYDSEAHPTQYKSSFGNSTTYLTFSGTFNEQTGNTSFPIDLTGHTVVGNGVMKVTGLPSDTTFYESHSSTCPYNPGVCGRCVVLFSWWQNNYCKVNWACPDIPSSGTSTNGPFVHYPGTLGYQSYIASAFGATTLWKAYPVEVKYNIDQSAWKVITSNLEDSTAKITVPISDGSHTLYFSESSAKNTKFSWYLYVPVDNSPDTYTTSIQYDSYGNVTSITDAESNTTTLTYSSTYSYAYLTEISATVGSNTITTKATYDSNRGWVTSIQEPKGVHAGTGYDYLYTYDLLGRITKKEFPLLSGQSQRTYVEAVYDDANRKVTIIDQLRHYIVREYDKLGRLTSTKWYTGTYGSGTLYATESYTYRYDGLLYTVTDPGSDTYTYTYDFLGRYTQITYPGSISVSYTYDDTNNKMTFTNARGYDRVYWHDWLSRLTKVEEEYTTDTFATTTYQYDEPGHLTSFTDAENHSTSYTYASLFGLTKVTYPDSEYEEYEYDNVGNLTSFIGCNGNITTYIYDSLYRLTQVEYEEGDIWSYYKQISVSNFSSNYQYKVTIHKGSGTDDADDVYLNNHCQDDFDDIRFRGSDKTTELDHYRESYTEGDSAVFWVELPATEQSIYIFYGNPSASSASNGENTFIFFDDCESGSPTDTWSENDASRGDMSYVSGSGEYKYGSKGLKVTQTSSSGGYVVKSNFSAQTNFVLDFWKKQVVNVSYLRVQDEGTSMVCRLWWNPSNDLKWYNNTTYIDTGYDWGSSWEHHVLTCTASDDKVVWEQDDVEIEDDAHEDSWTEGDLLDIFAGSKNYQGSVYFDNIYIRKYEATPPTFSFGSETENESGDSFTVSFTYDLNSSRTKMEDDAPNTNDYVEYAYDYWNRLTTETRHISTSTYTVSYEYDVASRLTKLTYPDNMQILYSYDDLNRTTEIKRYVDGSNDEVLMDNVQYDTESLLTQFDYGNDLEATFSYDSLDRLSTIDVKNGATSFLDLDYTYDNNSNITQLINGWRDTSSSWHSETESYSYDGLDRLTSAICTSWSHTYSYDKVGNRTAKDSVTYTINTVNEVTALSDGASFTYDDDGNRTQKAKGTDTWDYIYDYASRLTKVEKNSATLGEYIYDGDGKRIQVTEDSVTTTYIYSSINVLYEENTTGTATYMYGPTGTLAKRTTINQETNTFFYHTDHLGSTRLVTDDSKNIISAVTYHPFGEPSTEEGSEEYLFNGKEKDSTGLYYYGARYYDAEVGRFITRDPKQGRIENPQSLNEYTYCLNNPLKYVDPFGLDYYRIHDPSGNIFYVKNGKLTKIETRDGRIVTLEDLNELNERYKAAREKMRETGMGRAELNSVLKDLMDLFGIEYTEDENGVLSYRGYKIYWKSEQELSKYGEAIADYDFKWGTFPYKILLNYDAIEDIGMLYMVLRHELTHADQFISNFPYYRANEDRAEYEANEAMLEAYRQLCDIGFKTFGMWWLARKAGWQIRKYKRSHS